jgi:hypothetical protein
MQKSREDCAQKRDLLMLALSIFDIAGKFLLLCLTNHLLKVLTPASPVEHVIELVHGSLLSFRDEMQHGGEYRLHPSHGAMPCFTFSLNDVGTIFRN